MPPVPEKGTKYYQPNSEGEPAIVVRANSSAQYAPLLRIEDPVTADRRYVVTQDLWAFPARRIAPSVIITTFQSGHGWTYTPGTGTAADDTTDYIKGFQSAKLSGIGDGGLVFMRRTGLANQDLTGGKRIRITFTFTNATHVNGANVHLNCGNSSLANSFKYLFDQVPATPNQAMYKSGEWVSFTIPASELVTYQGAPNLATITDWQVQFRDDNTGNPASMNVNSIEILPPTTVFPNGVVSFTFDDSYATHYTQAKAYMDKYEYAGTAYTICDMIGTSGRLTMQQLKDMEKHSGWEVACNAYTSANHLSTLTGLPNVAAVEWELKQCKRWMRDNGFRGADHLAYPSGNFTAEIDGITQKYFRSARTIQRFPKACLPPEPVLRLPGMNIQTNNPTTLIDSAFASASWLILYAHD